VEIGGGGESRSGAGGGEGVSLELTEALIQNGVGHKSFDYRVLNLIMHRLVKRELLQDHLSFLRCSELLTGSVLLFFALLFFCAAL
jgi:hypothetical protein